MGAAPNDGTLGPSDAGLLGAILVQRGVLTEEQVAVAVEEQSRTGEQIGEVIVRLGFALAPSVAQALATQHGGPLKTEYGYAVGFGASTTTAPASPPPVTPAPSHQSRSAAPAPIAGLRVAARPEAAVPPAPASDRAPAASVALGRSAAAADDPALTRWQQQAQRLAAERDAALQQAQTLAAERDAARADLDALRAHSGELDATAVRLAAEVETLGRARTEVSKRAAELEQQLSAMHERAAARAGELEAELASMREEAARIVGEKQALERALDAADERTAQLEAEREQAMSRSTNLLRQVTEPNPAATSTDGGSVETATLLVAERQADEGPVAWVKTQRCDAPAIPQVVEEERQQHHTDQHAEDSSHLLLVPGANGYRLLEKAGPPPAPGSTLEIAELDGTSSRLHVAKLGPAPLPGTRLACAYLVVGE